MAYRSWLKDVKSIHDLGEFCRPQTRHKLEDWDREMRYQEKSRARQKAPIPVAEEYQFAFRSKMHDSWVEWIKRTPGELRIRINNDFAQNYVGEVCEAIDIHTPTFLNTKYNRDINLQAQPKDWVAPVDLIFDDPVYVNAVHEIPDGKLRWTKWEDIGRRGLYEADQYLSEWFFEQDSRIQCIVHIDPADRRVAFPRSIYLLIDCARVRAEDGRSVAIANILGPGAVDIWHDCLAGIDVDKNWNWWSIDYGYLERRMKARGLTDNDLRPRQKVDR